MRRQFGRDAPLCRHHVDVGSEVERALSAGRKILNSTTIGS